MFSEQDEEALHWLLKQFRPNQKSNVTGLAYWSLPECLLANIRAKTAIEAIREAADLEAEYELIPETTSIPCARTASPEMREAAEQEKANNWRKNALAIVDHHIATRRRELDDV